MTDPPIFLSKFFQVATNPKVMKKNHVILLISSVFFLGVSVVTLYAIRLKMSKNNFKQALVKQAKSELLKWQGLSELSQRASQLLISYWKSVGIHFSPGQMQDPIVHDSYPWSSAFISYLFFKVGAKRNFPYSAKHSTYFQYAKQNRNNKKSPLRGFRINEYAPKVGDLIVYSRQNGAGYDTSGHFPAHGELVVKTAHGYLKAIGANVLNTVKESTYKTDSKGYLKGNKLPFFMVIQNNIQLT